MTIVLDPDYLADENTVYPIRIDPTIEISYDNNGEGAIEDVTINSADDSNGSSGSLFVGKREEYGISRVLMRFPSLDLSNIPSADCITEAKLELRDVMCEEEQLTLYAHIFTGNVSSDALGIVTVTATHKVTNLTYRFKVYVDRYMWELVKSFKFSDNTAILIRDLYQRVDQRYPMETNAFKAWRCSRLLGGIVYGDEGGFDEFKRKDVAGKVYETSEKDYFVNILEYTNE